MSLRSEEFLRVVRGWSEIFMRRSFRDFKRFIDDYSLSVSQISTLVRLYHCGTCGVSDIGEHLGVTRAAASQLVDRLVGLGLLAREENPADRRVKQLTLTQAGREMIEAGIEARVHWIGTLMDALTSEEQDEIIRALKTLTAAARRMEVMDEQQLPAR